MLQGGKSGLRSCCAVAVESGARVNLLRGNRSATLKSSISDRGADMSEPESVYDEWPSAEEKTKNIAQAKALRSHAEKGGLRFNAYLPPELAGWLLGLIEKGIFHDSSEAAFVIFGKYRELEPHADLRRELLARSLQAAMDDPGPSIPAEEVIKKLKERRTPPEPAVWVK
jgi:antitoxin ParD1/3/4